MLLRLRLHEIATNEMEQWMEIGYGAASPLSACVEISIENVVATSAVRKGRLARLGITDRKWFSEE